MVLAITQISLAACTFRENLVDASIDVRFSAFQRPCIQLQSSLNRKPNVLEVLVEALVFATTSRMRSFIFAVSKDSAHSRDRLRE